jgi:NADPH-dependent 2,4-dienoyl-CoA reductase/sulfur reductase-like enzyme
MGAGFIGCIIMEALAMRGVKLSVVEMGDRMVPRMMGPTAGGMIKAWCRPRACLHRRPCGSHHGYPGRPSRAVPYPGPAGKLGQAVGLAPAPAPAPVPAPDCGRTDAGAPVHRPGLEADLVISATGVRPNIGFLADSGVRCLVGVLTDEHLQTNVPGIYAAGDCAEAFDKVSGKTIVSAIQPNAAEQARVAALNMVGKPHRAARASRRSTCSTRWA